MSVLLYFEDGKLIAKSGKVKVYKMNNDLFLEIGPGHTLWALKSEFMDYAEQLGDKPFGDCLEIGLGLGVASRYILSCPKVSSLTTVEKNSDVIAVQKIAYPINDKWGKKKFSDKHTILEADGLYYTYYTNKRFDFIFVDFYDVIDEDTLPMIIDMVNACKRILKNDGIITGWFDKSTPVEFINTFESIFEKEV